jgi:hypothetical protein
MNRNDQFPMTNDQCNGSSDARVRPLVIGNWSLVIAVQPKGEAA